MISVMIPLIWGFTFTSLRGSILPVTMVVLRKSITFGVHTSYSTVFGRLCIHRKTNVPMNTKAMTPATINLRYFFIFVMRIT